VAGDLELQKAASFHGQASGTDGLSQQGSGDANDRATRLWCQ